MSSADVGVEKLFLQCLATKVKHIINCKKRRREHESWTPGSSRNYKPKNPCNRCGKDVTARSRATSCDSCEHWTHNRCAVVFNNELYEELCNSGVNFTFVYELGLFHAHSFGLPMTRPTTTPVKFL